MALRYVEEFYIDIGGARENILKDWLLNPLNTEERIILGQTLNHKHTGLPVYDTQQLALYFWQGEEWQLQGSSEGGGGGPVIVDGNGILHTYNEKPSGLINGDNANFQTSKVFIPNSTRVYINGVRQTLGESDSYIEVTNQIIHFFEAPFEGATITIDYDTQTQI